MDVGPIEGNSVVEIAYDRIRHLIVSGDLPPDRRLNQGQLASSFGISTTSVREALHRLVRDTLVDFRRNRGFFVASPLRLHAVVNRLEVRLVLEPGVAKLAAERRSDDHALELERVIEGEAQAESPQAAHDLSREFHVALTRAARNNEFERALDALWAPDVGRQLLARRLESATWQSQDVAEHAAIAAAVRNGDGERAAQLMFEHINAAYRHWRAELVDGDVAPLGSPALAR